MIGRAVLDSGAVSAFASDKTLRAMVERLLLAGWDVEVPTVTLAEVTTGTARDAQVHWAIGRLGTTDTDAATARLAGSLRHRAARHGRRAPSGIDALVAAHAVSARTRAVVFTTDPDDLRALVDGAAEVAVIRI